jgi:hypothetical protein
MKPWAPISPYFCNILSKSKIPAKLPHKLGFIPDYLKNSKRNGITQPKTNSITNGSSI